MNKIEKFVTYFNTNKKIMDLLMGYKKSLYDDFKSNSKFVEIKDVKDEYSVAEYGFDYFLSDGYKLRILKLTESKFPILYLYCESSDDAFYLRSLDGYDNGNIVAKSILEWIEKYANYVLESFVKKINIFTKEKLEDIFLEVIDDFCEYNEYIAGYRTENLTKYSDGSIWSNFPNINTKFNWVLKLFLNDISSDSELDKLMNQFNHCKNRIPKHYDIKLYTNDDLSDEYDDDIVQVAFIIISEK